MDFVARRWLVSAISLTSRLPPKLLVLAVPGEHTIVTESLFLQSQARVPSQRQPLEEVALKSRCVHISNPSAEGSNLTIQTG